MNLKKTITIGFNGESGIDFTFEFEYAPSKKEFNEYAMACGYEDYLSLVVANVNEQCAAYAKELLEEWIKGKCEFPALDHFANEWWPRAKGMTSFTLYIINKYQKEIDDMLLEDLHNRYVYSLRRDTAFRYWRKTNLNSYLKAKKAREEEKRKRERISKKLSKSAKERWKAKKEKEAAQG